MLSLALGVCGGSSKGMPALAALPRRLSRRSKKKAAAPRALDLRPS